MSKNPNRQAGVVAMLDCLGWKELTRNESNWEEILDSAKRMQQITSDWAEREITFYFGDHAQPGELQMIRDIGVRTLFLSDTIVMATQPGECNVPALPGNEAEDNMRLASLIRIADVCATTIGFGWRFKKTPFLFRGCITEGSYHIDGTLLMGSAVDWAAENHESSVAPLVWVDPRLAKLVESRIEERGAKARRLQYLFRNHSVVFSNGFAMKCLCVNPFAYHAHDVGARFTLTEAIQAVEHMMGDGPMNIQLKRKEVTYFLECCWKDSQKHAAQEGKA